MEITTKYNMEDTVYYLERKQTSEQCSTCKGKQKINVTNGTSNWDVKCPDCKGKGKISHILHYDVKNGIVKGAIVKRGEHPDIFPSTKYILNDGVHKQEKALFSNIEEATQRCRELNEQIEYNRRRKWRVLPCMMD